MCAEYRLIDLLFGELSAILQNCQQLISQLETDLVIAKVTMSNDSKICSKFGYIL